ncbi:unnamed protein product [Ectocarpus sp. 12 AP-2014]
MLPYCPLLNSIRTNPNKASVVPKTSSVAACVLLPLLLPLSSTCAYDPAVGCFEHGSPPGQRSVHGFTLIRALGRVDIGFSGFINLRPARACFRLCRFRSPKGGDGVLDEEQSGEVKLAVKRSKARVDPTAATRGKGGGGACHLSVGLKKATKRLRVA